MLKIKNEQLVEIIRHAKESDPDEACGILAGKKEKVEKVYKMTNTSDKPEMCYFMDTKEQFKILKEIRNLGLEMAAIYHSHAHSEAYPSKRDIELAYYPAASYVIISLEDKGKPVARSFKIVEGKITEEEIKPYEPA